MTPSTPPAQQEYICTEENVCLIEDDFPFTAKEIRTRPHTSTPGTCPQNAIWDHCPHAATIANAARDQVLGEIQTIINNSRIFAEKQCIERVAENARDYYNIRASTLEYVLDKIKSLRTPTTKEHP
jgi:hypothetical protein